MESTVQRPSIEELRQKVMAETEAAEALAEMLAAVAQHTQRHDQARQLRELLESIMAEVKEAHEAESFDEYAFTRGRLISGGLGFIGGIVGAAIAGHENPLKAGARIADSSLSQISTFGKVLVAVRMEGASLNAMDVIALSKLAREAGRTEDQVRTALENQGYLLWKPEHFSQVINALEHEVLNGTLDGSASSKSVVSASNPGRKLVAVVEGVELYEHQRPATR